jgi:hypothetical protein
MREPTGREGILMMGLKLVFWIEDDETKKIIGEKRQKPIPIPDESEMVRVDIGSISEIKRLDELVPQCADIHRATHGRNLMLHEIFMSVGITIGRILEHDLAEKFGGDRLKRMAAFRERSQVS